MGSYIEDSSTLPGKSDDGGDEAKRLVDDDQPGLGTLLSGRLADADCDSVELIRGLREDE